MSVNGKGKPAKIVNKPAIPRLVKFTVVRDDGEESMGLYPCTEIKYISNDMRDGSTLVIFTTGRKVRVKETIAEVACRWGQREEVVRYEMTRKHSDGVGACNVALRASDITGIAVSREDYATVIVKAEFGTFPVAEGFSRVVEKASYCRPYAVLRKKRNDEPLRLEAIPVDAITKVAKSLSDGVTLVWTLDGHKHPVAESVDEVREAIEGDLHGSDPDGAEALASIGDSPMQLAA